MGWVSGGRLVTSGAGAVAGKPSQTTATATFAGRSGVPVVAAGSFAVGAAV
jgi:hypothetical protein